MQMRKNGNTQMTERPQLLTAQQMVIFKFVWFDKISCLLCQSFILTILYLNSSQLSSLVQLYKERIVFFWASLCYIIIYCV